jgi:hypothetical protein
MHFCLLLCLCLQQMRSHAMYGVCCVRLQNQERPRTAELPLDMQLLRVLAGSPADTTEGVYTPTQSTQSMLAFCVLLHSCSVMRVV